LWAWEWARLMLAQRPYVPTATMIITPTLVRHMATTARNGSSVACSSAQARGITGFMDVLAFTVVATMAAAITKAGTSAGVAGTMTVSEKEDSIMNALGTAAASMVEEGSTAAVTDSVVVDSMVTADFTVVATVASFMVAATAGMAGTDN